MRVFLKALWPLYISIWIVAALALTGHSQVSGWPWPFTAFSASSATIGTRNLVVGGASQSDPGLSIQTSSTNQACLSMKGTAIADGLCDLNAGGFQFRLGGVSVDAIDSNGNITPLNGRSATAGKVVGGFSVWNCTIPDGAAVASDWCDMKSSNSTIVTPYFDTMSVRLQSTCSTTFPGFAIHNTTHASQTGNCNTTATGLTTCSFNQIGTGGGGEIAGDNYSIEVTTAGSGCGATLGTEFFEVSVTMRE